MCLLKYTQPRKSLGYDELYPMNDNNTNNNLYNYMENEESDKGAEFSVQSKQPMINGNFESFHEYGKYLFKQNFNARNLIGMRVRNFVIVGVACQPPSRRLQATPPLHTSLQNRSYECLNLLTKSRYLSCK